MPKSNQDYTAWRFQSFDTENNGDGYDCELPSHVRTELAGLRRPPIAPIPPLIDRPVQVEMYGGIVTAFWRILANRDVQNPKPGPL